MGIGVTARNINTLPDGRYLIESGLYLVVRRGGTSRQYVLRYSFDGRRRDLSLGSCSIKRISIAKAEALKYRQMIAQHIDPILLRQEQRKNNAQRHETMDEYFEKFYKSYTTTRPYLTSGTLAETRRQYKKYISPIIGKVIISEIDVDDVRTVLDPMWNNKTCHANKLRILMSTIFNFARADGKMKGPNPAHWRGNLDIYYPPISKIYVTTHQAAPSFNELREFIKKNINKINFIYFQIFYSVVLCSSRLSEMSNLSWEEVDFDNEVITIDKERRKDRKNEEFRIPMTKQLKMVLELARKRTSVNYVFESIYNRGEPLNKASVWRSIVKGRNFAYTIHGIRSTFRNWAAENQVPDVVAEKCLMHSFGGAVFQAYMRSDLLDQRREVLQKWADEIISVDKLKTAISKLPRDSFGDVKYR